MAKMIEIPDNATNGDVVKILFDGYSYNVIKSRLEHFMWWNAPYDEEDEDESEN